MNKTALRAQALRNCAKEPIHIPGSVQPHGILLALKHPDLTILQVSENIFDMLGIRAEEVLHQPVSRFMNASPIRAAGRKLGQRVPRLLNPIPLELFHADGRILKFDGIIHLSGRIFILELERHVNPSTIEYGGFGGFYEAIRETTTQVMLAESLDEVLQLTCSEIRRLTQFSRVLAYRFDPDYNGVVVAESSDGKFSSLLHHRFPASDIPQQARELYATNWLRIIPDVDYTPSPLVPTHNSLIDQPLDLSYSVLRSVSPVHIEYMKSLGQGASMSISLLKGRKLWGLISCHHRKPHFLHYENRVAAEFIGQMVSSQIAAREGITEQEHRLRLKDIYDSLLRKGIRFGDVGATLEANATQLLALAQASGAAVVLRNEVSLIGYHPDIASIRAVLAWLARQDGLEFSTTALGKNDPQFQSIRAYASGLLAIALEPHYESAILWFRAEQKEAIPWGGNPNYSKLLDAEGIVHPRKSFATWLENVEGTSLAWQQTELEVTSELRTALAGLALRDGITQRSDTSADFRMLLAQSLSDPEGIKKSDLLPEDQRCNAHHRLSAPKYDWASF